MSQHDFNIDNQTAPAFRSDLNNALEALGTLSSGATAPSTTFANMIWYDTAANILKMRSEADDAWINVGYLCQSTNKFCILDDTNVVTTGGTQAGLLGDQATSAWEAGTSTTESLVSPAKVKAAFESTYGSITTSGALTYPSNSFVTWNHGLGTTPDPDKCGFYFIWKGGNTGGFSNGDRIHVSATGDDDGSGYMFVATSTLLKFAERSNPVITDISGSGTTVTSSSNVDVYMWARG